MSLDFPRLGHMPFDSRAGLDRLFRGAGHLPVPSGIGHEYRLAQPSK